MHQKNYSWNAGNYLKHSSAQYGWARELLGKLRLTGKASVLDIGCGDGKVNTMISSCLQNGNITGIDSSEDIIILARKTFPSSEYPNYCNLHVTKSDITGDLSLMSFIIWSSL